MENTMKMYVTADEAAQILGVSRGHQRKKKRKRLERNIWIDEVCRRVFGGSFFLEHI